MVAVDGYVANLDDDVTSPQASFNGEAVCYYI